MQGNPRNFEHARFFQEMDSWLLYTHDARQYYQQLAEYALNLSF
jgi:hypothetical protein